MQITAKSGHEQLEFKTRDAVIRIAETVAIGDFTLPGPGEYEVAGVMAEASGSVIRLDAGELVIGYVQPPATGKLSDHALEELGAVDIVCVRVGAGGFPPKEAATLIAQIDAPLVIPVSSEPAAIAALCSGGVACETQAGAFKISRSQLAAEGTRVITFA